MKEPLHPISVKLNCVGISASNELESVSELLLKNFRKWDAVVVGTLVFAIYLVFAFGNPRFLMNDDWVMRSFADGSFTGSPEIELVFVGKTVSVPLALLYGLVRNFAWYDFALLATNVFSFVLAARAVRNSIVAKVGWLFLAFSLFIWLIQFPTFTATALTAAGIGAVTVVMRFSEGPTRWQSFVAPAVLFIIGISWRFDAVIPSLILAGSLLIAFKLRLRLSWKNFLTASLAILFVLGGSVAAVNVTNALCLEQSQSTCNAWSKYREYNTIRGSFHGTARGAYAMAHSVPEAEGGWTSSEAKQFINWMYFDESIHGYNALKTLDAQIPRTMFPEYTFSGLSPLNFLNAWVERLKGDLLPKANLFILEIGLMGIIALSSVPLVRRRVYETVAAISIISLGSIFTLLVASLTRLPERVSIPIIGLWALGLLFLSAVAISSESTAEPSVNRSKMKESDRLILFSCVAFTAWLTLGHSSLLLLAGMIVGGAIGLGIVFVYRRYSPVKLVSTQLIIVAVAASTTLVSALSTYTGVSTQIPVWTDTLNSSKNVYSASVQQRWQHQVLFAPGTSADSFNVGAYSNLYVNEVPIIFTGWYTFSPHWYERQRQLGLPELSFEDVKSGKVYLLVDRRNFEIFSSLDEMKDSRLLWRDFGPYFEGSKLRVFGIVPHG